MPYVISDPCLQSRDQACVDVCPVDCIYEGALRFWIHPTECIDCGACEVVCPVNAIYYVDRDDTNDDLSEAREFFNSILPGREAAIGSPGGAAKTGALGTDLPRILTIGRKDEGGEH